jgi:hypothetical protein
MTDNIYTKRPVLMKLYKKGPKVQGGVKIVHPLGYKAGVGGRFEGFDVLPSAAQDEITAVEFNWRQYYGQTAISGREMKLNAGEHRVFDFVKAKIQIAEGGILNAIQADFWSTNGDSPANKGITGMPHIVSASRTYGGIDSTTNTWWQPNSAAIAAAVGGSLDLNDMLGVYLAASTNAQNEAPDMGVTTTAVWAIYHSLLATNQRYQDTEMANAGFPNITFMTKPIVWDPDATAQTLYFLNTNHLDLYQQTGAPIEFDGWRKPVNQDAMNGYFFTYLQLVCDMPRAMGKVTGITS